MYKLKNACTHHVTVQATLSGSLSFFCAPLLYDRSRLLGRWLAGHVLSSLKIKQETIAVARGPACISIDLGAGVDFKLCSWTLREWHAEPGRHFIRRFLHTEYSLVTWAWRNPRAPVDEIDETSRFARHNVPKQSSRRAEGWLIISGPSGTSEEKDIGTWTEDSWLSHQPHPTTQAACFKHRAQTLELHR